MRRIIGIGQTVFDIIFKDNQPALATPGGSVFNSMISLGRLGANPIFISEVGRDAVGKIILDYMELNGVSIDNMYCFYEKKSPLSLAFINNDNQVSYSDYIEYPESRLDIVWPRLDNDDFIIFGSFYSLSKAIRPTLIELLNYATDRKAIILYDVDFKIDHAQQAMWVMSSVIENLEFADIVRGSLQDFVNLYKADDVDKIYKNHIKFYCQNFICTDGPNGIYLRTSRISKHYDVPQIQLVSKVGAGDAFNAGVIYALNQMNVSRDNLSELQESQWDAIIKTAIEFANNVCLSFDNSIAHDFAKLHAL